MIGYIIVIGLLLLMYGYFTVVVFLDPEITRAQRALRLALIWLLPIFGIYLVSRLYARGEVDPRDNVGRGNPYQ